MPRRGSRSPHSSIGLRLATALAPLALIVLATEVPVACATTVGGLSTLSSAPFALVTGRLFIPVFATDNPGEAAPGPGPPVTETATSLQSFAAAKHSAHTLTLDASTVGSGQPALASGGGRTAAAWVGAHGFQSALVSAGGASVSSPVAVPVSGAASGYAVAVDSTGARAVLWLDKLGLRVQTISVAGTAAASLTLASNATTFLSLTSDDAGGWWAVWIAAGRVLAVHVAASGGATAPIDVAAAPRHTIAARLLYPRPWRTVADGSGGVWVGFANAIVRVSATGVRERLGGRGLALAEGDRATTLAESPRAGAIELRPLGRPGLALRLRDLGVLLDLAYDPSRRTTELLTAASRGRVELTAVNARGRVSSLPVSGCPRPGSGEVLAAGGLVGVACGGRHFQAESVETGGDFEEGRYVHYYLLRGGRRLRGEALFEGLHAY